MNSILKIASLLIFIGTLASCKKSYLETQPIGQFLGSNYYQTPDQAFTGVVASYSKIGKYAMDHLVGINIASDDCFAGGGGPGDYSGMQALSDYTLLTPSIGTSDIFWGNIWQGVSNSNIAIANLPNVPNLDPNLLKRYLAECKFLRAHYYFDLVRLFGNVPLILTPLAASEIYNQPQVAPSAVYTQIETDLKDAIASGGLPVTVVTTENGRVTKGAAIGLLGKVYLYEKKWTEAASQFALINGTPGSTSTYGYKLLSNFSDIFNIHNKFNSESIFEITRENNVPDYPNAYSIFIGARSANISIYASGYGFNMITTQLVNLYKNNADPRYNYTIINMDSLSTATGVTYTPSYQNTGYFSKKYAPLQAEVTNNWAFGNDYIEMRLADTYLMEAEALVQGGGDITRATALLTAVRARVGLTSRPATLDNIYLERHLELAQEGHRWYDLVRTGKAASALAFKGFAIGKNEILPIPQTELNNTKLVQNPGYPK